MLEEMAARGDDLLASREVEFAHLFADQAAATAFCDWAHRRGYAADPWLREDGVIDVIVRHEMVPELVPLTELELELAAAAREHGGEADGWGCFAVPIPG